MELFAVFILIFIFIFMFIFIAILYFIIKESTRRTYRRQCVNCGCSIREPYTRCYRCHQILKDAGWHDPENLPGIEEHDAQYGRSKFYVYILDTDYGHYVGHSGNIGARLRAHVRNEVFSTANGSPRIIWRSYPCSTRTAAKRFEAALKSWRDNRKDKFTEVTGVAPVPFWRE